MRQSIASVTPDNEEMAHIMHDIEEDRQSVKRKQKQKKFGGYISLIDYFQDKLKNSPIV
ncbi:hypothetical protein V6B14_08545 [Sporosarcina psychrophila]|uniref:hypothetical protein n=1 Tax=Sporosarcina psychrophila TaxID=1476 RepID=UPI0030CF98C3